MKFYQTIDYIMAAALRLGGANLIEVQPDCVNRCVTFLFDDTDGITQALADRYHDNKLNLDARSFVEEIRETKRWAIDLLRDEWKRQVKEMDSAVKENMKSKEYRDSLDPGERS